MVSYPIFWYSNIQSSKLNLNNNAHILDCVSESQDFMWTHWEQYLHKHFILINPFANNVSIFNYKQHISNTDWQGIMQTNDLRTCLKERLYVCSNLVCMPVWCIIPLVYDSVSVGDEDDRQTWDVSNQTSRRLALDIVSLNMSVCLSRD